MRNIFQCKYNQRIKLYLKKYFWWILGGGIIIFIGFLLFPRTYTQHTRSLCHINSDCLQCIISSDGDTLYYRPDSLSLADYTFFLKADSAHLLSKTSGIFVSNGGHIITSNMFPPSFILDNKETKLRTTLKQYAFALKIQHTDLKKAVQKFNDYAHTHTAIDDGYTRVMELQNLLKKRIQYTDALLNSMNKMIKSKSLRLSFIRQFFVTTTTPNKGKITSRTYKAHVVKRDVFNNFLLLQLDQEILPTESERFVIYRFSPSFWTIYFPPTLTCGYPSLNTKILPDVAKLHSTMSYFEGLAPTINKLGQLVGAQYNGHTLTISQFSDLYYEFKGYWNWLFYNIIKKVQRWFHKDHPISVYQIADKQSSQLNINGLFSLKNIYGVRDYNGKIYAGQLLNELPHGIGTLYYEEGEVYHGNWIKGKRFGSGSLTTLNAKYTGIWNHDTLTYGSSIYYDGKLYKGHYDLLLNPVGEGSMLETKYISLSPNDSIVTYKSYYEGEWNNGKRSGFGISVDQYPTIKAGIWKNNKFLGEQMIYTPHRVYGIDISKFQHKKGKQTYPINWNTLKITSLGKLKRRIIGEAQYPVSFIYIKSTEGLTIHNPYYKQDIQQARQRKIAAGAYHFFSPYTSGIRQAYQFLRFTQIKKGDLTPMLDIEPSDQQIEKMGGDSILFREILNWVKIVEKRIGKKPVLYLSQMFINKHFPQAPKYLQQCPVWIARYSEYKPYVKLRFWQLTPFGRVQGITGDVDINVFNGSKEQFNDLLINDNL